MLRFSMEEMSSGEKNVFQSGGFDGNNYILFLKVWEEGNHTKFYTLK